MDQELYGITEFLIERAKSGLCKKDFTYRGYFIMRYSTKPKLVYAPFDISLLEVPIFWRMIPSHIEQTWQARKAAAEFLVELVAVCTISIARYAPRTEGFCQFPDRMGRSCLSTTVNTRNEMYSYLTFFEKDHNGITFGANEPNMGGFTTTGKSLFPKSA